MGNTLVFQLPQEPRNMSITLAEAEQWLKNLDRAKDIGRCWETEEEWKKLITELRPEAPERDTVKPGDAFNENLCKCRLWNKGYAKQCSYASKTDGVCTFHSKKIETLDGWAFGFYDEEVPSHYLHNYGKKKKGMTLFWKDVNKVKRDQIEPDLPSLEDLKKEYKELKGGNPKGAKANDRDWLNKKIAEKKVEIMSVVELNKIKDEYESLFGNRPRGSKANDIEWLKTKIMEQKSEDTETEDDTESEDESEDDGKGVSLLEDLTFEGVNYKMRRSSFEVFKNGAMVGEWETNSFDGWINWESHDFYEIHIRDENYEGEEMP